MRLSNHTGKLTMKSNKRVRQMKLDLRLPNDVVGAIDQIAKHSQCTREQVVNVLLAAGLERERNPKMTVEKFQVHIRDKDEPTWTCQDGRVLKISEMETSHIVNSLYMLMRATRVKLMNHGLSALSYASSALDGASMAAESEGMQMLDIADRPLACFEHAMKHTKKARPLFEELCRRRVPFERRVWRRAAY